MKRFGYVSLALTVMVACASAAADDAKPLETPYYPLKVGNTWAYKAGEIRVSAKVAKWETFENQLCARVETFSGEKLAAVEHVAVKEDGVRRYAYGNQKVDPPLLFLKLPAVKDQTWNVASKMQGVEIAGTFTSGIAQEVTVPAGTYKNVYTCSGDCTANVTTKMSFTYFFAKDVGMIKQIIKTQGQEITIELEKFEPGK